MEGNPKCDCPIEMGFWANVDFHNCPKHGSERNDTPASNPENNDHEGNEGEK